MNAAQRIRLIRIIEKIEKNPKFSNMQIMFKRNASSATAERLFHF